MLKTLPSIVLTGASGFIGRSFLEAAKKRYRIYAIARRPQHEARVPNHANISWIQVDIANWSALKRVMGHIKRDGGADFLVHLAAYYDLSMEDNAEYLRTNVNGTRHMLEQAKWLCVKRFLFASSAVACRFPLPGQAITEETPADADFPYARSKRIGEEFVREYSKWFPCSILRLAAVFSDWCEYAPLYLLLSTWLSKRWNARILGGRGLAAVPYIHTRDVNRLLFAIIGGSADLPPMATYMASPNGATSHRDLFELATRAHFDRAVKPVFVPKPLALVGVAGRDLVGRMIGHRPFERPWMLKYLDVPLLVDSTRTQRALDWSPTPRLQILRRLIFLIEKMKSNPQEWGQRNESALKRPPARPGLVIHDAMMEAREAIIDGITAYLQSPARRDRFPSHSGLSAEEVSWSVGIVYDLLMAAVRTADRTLLLNYVHDLSRRRFVNGFSAAEVSDALLTVSEITTEELLCKPEVMDLESEVRDAITLPTALALDGIQDAYEAFRKSNASLSGAANGLPESARNLEEIVDRLNAFYRPSGEEESSSKGTT